MIFKVVLNLTLVTFLQALSLSEVRIFFGDKNCISGSLSSLNQNQEGKVSENTVMTKIDLREELLANQVNKDKSTLSFINELAQYNGITYSYELIKEEGPPHSKIFTISLFLGDETYTESGKSIKVAQQEAASLALKNTKYEHPPVVLKGNEKAPTPTVLLNNLAAKLGLKVTYESVTNDILETLESDESEIEFGPRKSYLQKLNDTIYSNDTIHIRKDQSDLKGPFKVRVDVSGAKFIGEAHTKKNARHEAALKALKALKSQEANFHCLKEDDNCKSKKQSVKSPISLVYESAQKRNLGVNFEIVNEEGPSHKKMFTTKCTVGNLEATGQGNSKKESKRAASENILPLLLETPEIEGKHEKNIQNSKKKPRKNKKNKVIKTTFDKIDRMLDNVVDYGKGLLDKISGKEDITNNDDSKPAKNKRSPTQEIIKVGRILQLNMQYSDFEENHKTYSILDLGTKPSFICLGEGVNKKNSRDLAATHGMDVLFKLGLLDNLLDKSMKISNILDKEEEFENFWLDFSETQEEKQK